jgi:hypothetical protein
MLQGSTMNKADTTEINMYRLTNKHVDITYIAHDAFLEQPSSVTLKVERLERLIILKVLGASKPWEPTMYDR